MSDVATEMRALAEALAAGDEGLDFGLDSLKELEQRILARRRSSIAGDEQQAWGAYLGETLVRQAEGVQWIDFASAAAEAPTVARLGEDAETSALLRAGDRLWFPHVKVAKLIANGAVDSIAALAAVVVAQQSPQEPPETWDLSEPLALARAFMARPTAERLCKLDRLLSDVPRRELPRFYRESGLAVAPLAALFAAPASGRGYARVDPGQYAAWQAAALLVSGAVPCEAAMIELRALLSDRTKVVRTRAAFVVASCLLAERRFEELSTLARDGKAGVDLGALDAIRWDVGDRRMKDEEGTVDVEPLAPVLVLGLEAKDERRESALDALFTIACLRCDIAPVLPALIASLASDRPAVRQRAMEVLTTHAYNVMHGRARYDERLAGVVRRIAELSRPRRGAQKVTKEQIAARYALAALVRIREHFDADTAKLVEEALAAVAHVR